jgi:hypothetical protein
MKKDNRIKKIARFWGMFIGIAFSGFIIGGILALIGSAIMKDKVFGLGRIVGSVGGLIIGYPVGVICGTILFRTWLKYNGAIISGIFGCLLGAIIILVLVVLLKIVISFVWTLSLYFIAAPLLGTIGFYLGRKPERKQKHRKRK